MVDALPISDHLENLKKYVEAVAPEYDEKYGAPLSEHETRILVDASRFTKGWIVEIGCGTGRHSRLLATLNRPLICIDFSRSMIKRAKKKLSDSDQFWFVLADAKHLPIGAKTVGLVVCLGNTMGGIPSSEARQKVVLESERVLSQGGLLILDYRNRLSLHPPHLLKYLTLNLSIGCENKTTENHDGKAKLTIGGVEFYESGYDSVWPYKVLLDKKHFLAGAVIPRQTQHRPSKWRHCRAW